jgi:hypothetical protein
MRQEAPARLLPAGVSISFDDLFYGEIIKLVFGFPE